MIEAVHKDATSRGHGAELGLKADKASGWDAIVEPHATFSVWPYVLHITTARSQCLHHGPLMAILDVNAKLLKRLVTLPVDLQDDYAGSRDGELVAFAPHGLHHHGAKRRVLSRDEAVGFLAILLLAADDLLGFGDAALSAQVLDGTDEPLNRPRVARML